jgi:hypothetical protein
MCTMEVLIFPSRTCCDLFHSGSTRKRKRAERLGRSIYLYGMGFPGQKMSSTSTMAALQSGQRPRPARSSRAQPRQKVRPQGMKAAPLARAMHTQQQPATTPLPAAGSGSASSVGSATAAESSSSACAAAPGTTLHCQSVCSRSTISETLWSCSSAAAGGGEGGDGGGAASAAGAGAGGEAVVGGGSDTAQRTRGSPAPATRGWSSRIMYRRQYKMKPRKDLAGRGHEP